MSFDKNRFEEYFGEISDTIDVKVLSDICPEGKGMIISGPFGSNISSKFFVETGIPVIRGNNLSLQMDKFIDDGFVYVTEEKANSLNTYAIKDDLIFTAAGTIGQVGIITDSCKYEKYIISNKQLRARLDKKFVNPLYAYYWFAGKKMQEYIILQNTGSTIPLINLSVLRNLPIPMPSIDVQNKIVAVISAMDKKIENNNQINRNLSEQIETLYMEHFLEDCNGVLSDICNYTKERIDVELLTDETYYSTENMLPNKAGATVASGLPTTGKTPACFPGNVLISNIRPYFKKIVYCHEESGCSADVLCFVAKNSLLAPYIFATLYVDKFFDYMVAGSKGTKMPRGDKQQIMRYPVYIPTEEELKVFSLTASNILEMIHLNTLENKRLEAIRDSLLPKLMSGELDVSQVVL